MSDFFILRNLKNNDNIELAGIRYTLGRHGDCDIVLDNQESSREHAALTIREGQLVVEDLNSTNGTYVNNRELRGAERIVGNGDIITIGYESFMVIAPGASGNETIFGSRVAREDSSYVLEQRDADQTAVRAVYPSPPGWSPAEVKSFSGTPEKNDEQLMTDLMRRESINVSNAEAAFMITSSRGQNQIFTVPPAGEEGKGQWSLGRAKSCDITIDDAVVSGNHAILSYAHGQWSVEDNNSTNGMRINGRRAERGKLQRGDILALGDVSLLFMPTGGQ